MHNVSAIETTYYLTSLQERHAAHYLIVNLCSERVYSLDTFHGNCIRCGGDIAQQIRD